MSIKYKVLSIASTLLLLSLYTLYSIPSTIHAADSTPSADVKNKLEILKQEIASKAAKLKSEINKKLQNKAYIGVIKQKSDTTLTLASRTGTKVVNINQDTVYEPALSKKNVLKEEDSVAALGDVDETGVLTARKIVKLPVATSQAKTIIWGEVISVSDDLITIRDRDRKNVAISISKVNTRVKENQIIIATGSLNKNNILDAKFVHITEGLVKVKPKEATKSATPSATPKKNP